jgi:hypothetical protein
MKNQHDCYPAHGRDHEGKPGRVLRGTLLVLALATAVGSVGLAAGAGAPIAHGIVQNVPLDLR